jgi:hypothetical protein
MLMNPSNWALLENGQGVHLGGLKTSFSSDMVTFETMREPFLVLDQVDWTRPAPTDLIAYPSVVNYTDGNNTFGSNFLLFYTYIQPNEGFDKRYLAVRDVSVTLMSDPQSPQVGVALSRWFNPALKDRWSTTAMIPGTFSTYQYEGDTGYVMTRAHPTLATTKLEECVSNWPGHPDHMVTNDGMCAGAGYTRLRTVGWVFQSAQPNTVPLYRCYNPTEKHHFASNSPTCEGKGNMEWQLGYALAN